MIKPPRFPEYGDQVFVPDEMGKGEWVGGVCNTAPANAIPGGKFLVALAPGAHKHSAIVLCEYARYLESWAFPDDMPIAKTLPDGDAIPKGAIHTPEMCKVHQSQLVHGLRIPPEGSWQLALVIASILLFQAATANDKVWQRCGLRPDGTRDEGDLSLVLAEIGCLACFDSRAFERVFTIMRKRGLSDAAKISRGVIEDPNWPYLRGKDPA